MSRKTIISAIAIVGMLCFPVMAGQGTQKTRIAPVVAKVDRLESELAKLKDHISAIGRERTSVMTVDVTAYTNDVSQTDSDPNITALNRSVKAGRTCAISPDLVSMGFLGREVYIRGHGVFVATDVTHGRMRKKVDLFLAPRDAQSWKTLHGKQVVFLPAIEE